MWPLLKCTRYKHGVLRRTLRRFVCVRVCVLRKRQVVVKVDLQRRMTDLGPSSCFDLMETNLPPDKSSLSSLMLCNISRVDDVGTSARKKSCSLPEHYFCMFECFGWSSRFTVINWAGRRQSAQSTHWLCWQLLYVSQTRCTNQPETHTRHYQRHWVIQKLWTLKRDFSEKSSYIRDK